jgi:3-methyl-2-oxobutanoate hydroxymethyltransferase
MSKAPDPNPPVTLRTLAKMAAAGEAFACLTCYEASTARWLERAGVHVLLVGDTAAEMVLGFKRTIDMPLDVLVALTAGVKRGAPRTVVMADMPFMSYQAGEDEAVKNAGRFLTEGLADVVKIEADASFAGLVRKMVRAGVPVCGHVGSRPQQVALTSGRRCRRARGGGLFAAAGGGGAGRGDGGDHGEDARAADRHRGRAGVSRAGGGVAGSGGDD